MLRYLGPRPAYALLPCVKTRYGVPPCFLADAFYLGQWTVLGPVMEKMGKKTGGHPMYTGKHK